MGIESRDSFRDVGPRGRRRRSSQRSLVSGIAIGLVVLLAASPAVSAPRNPLTAAKDPWRAWLADERTCPRGDDRSAPAAVQAHVLLCLVNYARQRRGVRPLVLSPVLSRTAASKARDIVRCHDFSHRACGKQAFQAAKNVGYRGSLGENLYVAEGAWTAPRPALDAWLNSPRHRKNLLAPRWRSIGIALHGGADVAPIRNGVVWVNHFG